MAAHAQQRVALSQIPPKPSILRPFTSHHLRHRSRQLPPIPRVPPCLPHRRPFTPLMRPVYALVPLSLCSQSSRHLLQRPCARPRVVVELSTTLTQARATICLMLAQSIPTTQTSWQVAGRALRYGSRGADSLLACPCFTPGPASHRHPTYPRHRRHRRQGLKELT